MSTHPGCPHCNSPLFCGRQCGACGKVFWVDDEQDAQATTRHADDAIGDNMTDFERKVREAAVLSQRVYSKDSADTISDDDWLDIREGLLVFANAIRQIAGEEHMAACRKVADAPSSLWQEPGCWKHASDACEAAIRELMKGE